MALLPTKPQVLLSDHGSEFEAGFAHTLKHHGIARWYTHPKTPKRDAHVERFNRTVQESFVDDHEDLLFTDLKLCNQKLADWLVFSIDAGGTAALPHPTAAGLAPRAPSARPSKAVPRLARGAARSPPNPPCA